MRPMRSHAASARPSWRLLAAGLALALAVPAAGGTRPRFEVAVTDQAENGIPILSTTPRASLDCHSRIYIVVTAHGLPVGRHVLQVIWINPQGAHQERTRYLFYASGKRDRVWAWLKLKRPGAGIMDRVFLGNRASGMEAFIGEWQARVRVDRRTVAKPRFKVLC